MRTLVTGATGYIGMRLVAALHQAGGGGHTVVATARRPEQLAALQLPADVERARLDVDDAASCAAALRGVDVACYLVHAIGEDDYAETDRRRAETFATAARAAGVRRVVYLGGLVPEEELSEHLASRAEVGEVLAEHGPELVWLRAAVVLGAGSASYEITRYLADWLPLVPLPPWMDTLVQPVAVDDVLAALVAATGLDPLVEVGPGSWDLGGDEQLPYAELVRRYVNVAGLHRLLLPTPPVPTALAAWVVSRLTPLPQAMVADLVLSLSNTMVADPAHLLQVRGTPTTVTDALRRAGVGSARRRRDLPGVCALPDPLQLCASDAGWAVRARY